MSKTRFVDLNFKRKSADLIDLKLIYSKDGYL